MPRSSASHGFRLSSTSRAPPISAPSCSSLVGQGADAILTDIYDSDAPIIQRQLVEFGHGRLQQHLFLQSRRLRHARAQPDRGHQGPELHHRRHSRRGLQREVQGADRPASTPTPGAARRSTTPSGSWRSRSTSPTASIARRSAMRCGRPPTTISACPATATRASTNGACKLPTSTRSWSTKSGKHGAACRRDRRTSSSSATPMIKGTPLQFAPSEEEFQKLYPNYQP